MGWIFSWVIAGLLWSTAGVSASTNTDAVAVDLTPAEKEWIAQHPAVRVAVLASWAPFSYTDSDGKQIGIDIDILDRISRNTGLQFEIAPAPSWEQLVQMHDQWDMTTGTAETPLRAEYVNFTKPYATAPDVIVEREGKGNFGPVGILRNLKIAAPRKHLTTQMLAERLPTANLITPATQQECFDMVSRGEVDATVVNLFVASQYLNTHPESRLVISGVFTEYEFPLRFAVLRRPELAPLVGILNKGLGSISSKEKDDIISKHLLFGLEGKRRVAFLRQRFSEIAIGVSALLLLVLFWNISLRREIRARRKIEAELRESNDSLKVFSQSLSHDLKGPMRAITGFSEALKEDAYEKLNPEEKEYLDRVVISAHRMNTLIRDVLTYTYASHGNVSVQAVEVGPILDQLIGEFPPEQRRYFHVDQDFPLVRAHANLLARSLTNLLSNAIKFVPPDRKPDIWIHAEERGPSVRIWVEDNGIGIAPKDQKRVFNLFERVGTRGYEGTGIGLAVVSKAVERMDGTTGVESEFGKGSKFWIELPSTTVEPSLAKSRHFHFFHQRAAAAKGA